jgi:hypothetical protein
MILHCSKVNLHCSRVNLNKSLVTSIHYSQLLQVDLLWLKGDQDEIPWLQGEPACSRMSLHGSKVSLHGSKVQLYVSKWTLCISRMNHIDPGRVSRALG